MNTPKNMFSVQWNTFELSKNWRYISPVKLLGFQCVCDFYCIKVFMNPNIFIVNIKNAISSECCIIRLNCDRVHFGLIDNGKYAVFLIFRFTYTNWKIFSSFATVLTVLGRPLSEIYTLDRPVSHKCRSEFVKKDNSTRLV